MKLSPVVHYAVAAVSYDASARTMGVKFRSGALYEYYVVDRALYEAMLQPHSWRRVGKQIKAHSYVKIS